MTLVRRAVDRLLETPIVYERFQAPFAAAKLRPFLRRANLETVHSVLDVGCGPGTNAPTFEHLETYVGIDINADYIRTAQQRFQGRFLVGDVGSASALPDEHFDVVFANSLMHHLPDDVTRRLLQRFATLVTPIGAVHILDLVLPDSASPAWALAKLDRGRFPRSVHAWRTLFTEHLEERHCEVYPVGLAGVPLWWMIYFLGVPR